jgi:cobalt-zinc-cadmium efflux system membrane fusion protein
MKNKLSTIFTIRAAVVCGVLLVGCSREEQKTPTPTVAVGNVTLTTAQRQSIHLQTVATSRFGRTIETTGTVGFDSDQATTVLAPISGPAAKLLVSLGASVKAGEPLAMIESPDYAAAISAYRKGVATAKNARRIAEMDTELFKADAIARNDMEQAQTDAINAEADRDAALEQLHSIGVDSDTIGRIQNNQPVTNVSGVIRAPLTGIVVEKLITPGQLLQAATTPCFTVADLSQVWVLADIYESDLSNVALGDAAEIVTSATATSYPGVVDNISALVDPNTRSIAVRVVAKNPDGILKKQMYVRVLIHSKTQTSGVLAPVSAVLRNEENLPFVYIAPADGSFQRRRIGLGSRVGDQFEIISGLKDGEQIVVEGGLFVQFLQDQ